MSEKAKYTHGHHSSVVNSHARRTVQNSASFLIPHLTPSSRVLDLGCGPGSITVGIAKLVPQGSVTAGDVVEDVLVQARERAAAENLSNVTFQKLDGNKLPFQDGTFDVAFCHQVIQHVSDPVGILKEMARVVRKGGVVAVREADYLSFAWYPETPGLALWGQVYQATHKSGGSEPNAGRYLKAWAARAGFMPENVTFTWDTWVYQHDDATVWGQSWRERVLYSSFATSAVEQGAATREDLETISRAWDEFSTAEDRVIMIPSGEIVCRV